MDFQKGTACMPIRPVLKVLSWAIFLLHHFPKILHSRCCKGVACGSGKLYLCFWVTKLVAVSVHKQKPTTSWFGGDCPPPLSQAVGWGEYWQMVSVKTCPNQIFILNLGHILLGFELHKANSWLIASTNDCLSIPPFYTMTDWDYAKKWQVSWRLSFPGMEIWNSCFLHWWTTLPVHWCPVNQHLSNMASWLYSNSL